MIAASTVQILGLVLTGIGLIGACMTLAVWDDHKREGHASAQAYRAGYLDGWNDCKAAGAPFPPSTPEGAPALDSITEVMYPADEQLADTLSLLGGTIGRIAGELTDAGEQLTIVALTLVNRPEKQ